MMYNMSDKRKSDTKSSWVGEAVEVFFDLVVALAYGIFIWAFLSRPYEFLGALAGSSANW